MIDRPLPTYQEYIGHEIVLDLDAPFVVLGRFIEMRGDSFLLEDADLHDLRDTASTREKYTLDCREHGIRPNRRKVFVPLRQVVAISLLEAVIES
ncbi:Hypothetical protein PBC10988_26990 [Planctomycetales bacterium 10988]|nr:Hypothetical protein PBC10988_26990 [Planctomycetales bacterium 10988]